MNDRTEEKLKDISGMEKAIKDLLQQAWNRGYKYGYARGVECNKEVKVYIDGEQIYPKEAKNDDKCVGCHWNYNGFCIFQGKKPCNYEEAKDDEE